MASGGARIGAGRKPGSTKGRLLGVAGQALTGHRVHPPLPPAVSGEEREKLVEPPASLFPGAAAFWREYAPQAVAERTLTPATAAGFRKLAREWAYAESLAERIEHLGAGTQEALPYLREFRGYTGRLDISLKSFKLSAFGKPATSDKPKPAENPWAALAK